MKKYGSAALIGLLVACTPAKEVSSESLKEVQTNGIYVAFDPFTTMVSGPSMEAIKNQQAVYIIRFLDQKSGVVIPDKWVEGESMSKEKIQQMFDWALNYENMNPNEKKFVHFTLEPAKGDSIVIMQRDGKQFSSFTGTNERDSLLLNHDFGLDMPGRVAEQIKRPLVFKFYPLSK